MILSNYVFYSPFSPSQLFLQSLSLPLIHSFSFSSSYSRVTILEGWSVDVVLCVKQITIVSNKSNVTFLTTSSPLTSLSFFLSFPLSSLPFFLSSHHNYHHHPSGFIGFVSTSMLNQKLYTKKRSLLYDYLKEMKNGIRIVI